MTNRREFLQAAAIAGLPVMTGATRAFAVPRDTGALPRPALHAFLIDSRFDEARALGARLASIGTPVHATADGDITQLWMRDIAPVWREKPVAIGGLTARPALFCLEQLALSFGLRVVFHGEHIVSPDGRAEHTLLRGAQDAKLSSRDLSRAGAQWPTRILEAIAAHGPQLRASRVGPSEASLEPVLPAGAQLLTSWIIAPV